MSGCNCKNNNQFYGNSSNENDTIFKKIINYTLRSAIFLFSLILLPIILIASVWVLFKTFVLNKEFNFFDFIKLINKKFKINNDDDDDDDDDDSDYDDDDDDEYELMDVEYITNNDDK